MSTAATRVPETEEQVKKQDQQQQQQQQEEEKPQVKKNVPSDWRTKINWERIYKYFAYFVLGLVPFFIRDMLSFREEVISLGHDVVPWDFLLYGAIFTVVFTFVRQIFFWSTHSCIHKRILPQYQGEVRNLHTRKVQKWLFDFIYYTGTSLYGYICFKDAPWYPLSFSEDTYGNATRGVLHAWPGLPVQDEYYGYFKWFLIVQLGHHTWGLLDLVIVRRKLENRYYEWLTHHLLAFTLIFYSAYFNFSILAVAVLIIHDIGDIFLVMFKTWGEWYSRGIVFKYLVFQMISGWFLSRVYLYPKVIIWPIIIYKQLYYDHQKYFEIAFGAYIYQTLLLCCLYLLHLYWFAQMITLLTSYIRKQLKEGRNSKQDSGYGNEFDYVHYNKKNK